MQSSSCGQPGVVQCSQLGPGVDQACCPQYTTCAKGYNATTTSVRCDIQELALQSLLPADKSSMGVVIEPMQSTEAQESTQSSQPAEQTSSSEAAQSVSGTQAAATSRSATQITRMTEHTSTGAPESVSTTHTDDSPPAETASTPPSSSESSLTTGAWIGIVVGAVAVVALLCLAVWLIWRKRRRARSQAVANVQQYPLDKRPDAGLQDQRKEDLYEMFLRRQEMEDTRRQELWAGAFSPKEMQAREVAELEGSAR